MTPNYFESILSSETISPDKKKIFYEKYNEKKINLKKN